MKLILLVGVAAVGGVMASDYVQKQDFYANWKAEAGTKKAVGIGITAGIGALTFGLLNRFL